jgi:hypothetical protein
VIKGVIPLIIITPKMIKINEAEAIVNPYNMPLTILSMNLF